MNLSSSYTRHGDAPLGYLFMLIGAMIVCSMAFMSLLIPALELSVSDDVHRKLLLAVFSSLLSFGLPAWLVELYHYRKYSRHIYIRSKPGMRWIHVGQAAALVVMGGCVAELATGLMQYLPAPWAWMRELEETSAREMELLLSGDDVGSWMLMLLAIVVAAPLAEELFFRGALMGWGIVRTGRIHLSVWVVAVIFGVVHLEWSGLPGRIVLGAILGYAAAYGGIKMAMIVHVLNNMIVLIVYKSTGDMAVSQGVSTVVVIGSVVSMVLLYLLFSYMGKHPNTYSKVSTKDHESIPR